MTYKRMSDSQRAYYEFWSPKSLKATCIFCGGLFHRDIRVCPTCKDYKGIEVKHV